MSPQPAAEIPATPEQYTNTLAFISPEAIDALRYKTYEDIDAAEKWALDQLDDNMERALQGSGMKQAARQQVLNQLEQDFTEYLDGHIEKDAQPEIYENALRLLRFTSVANMSDEIWYNGKPDDEGSHTKVETSGWMIAENVREELRRRFVEDPPVEDDPTEVMPVTPEQVTAAETELKDLRATLAKISVARRGLIRKNTKKAKALEEQYQQAEAAYKEAYTKFGALSVDMLRATGKNEAELKLEIIKGTIEERRAFTEAEYDVYQGDDSKRGKLVRWLAGKKVGFLMTNAGIGLAGGAAARVASKSLVALGAGIAAPAAIAATFAVKTTGAAVRASLGNRVHNQIQHNKRAEKDMAHLDQTVAGAMPNTLDESHQIAEFSADHLFGNISKRVEKDQTGNRYRVIGAMAISSVAALGGWFVADRVMDHGNGLIDNRIGSGNTIDRAGERIGAAAEQQYAAPQDLEWLKSPQAHAYFEGMKQFKEANPTLTMANGVVVAQPSNPNLVNPMYEQRAFELWNQFWAADAAQRAADMSDLANKHSLPIIYS